MVKKRIAAAALSLTVAVSMLFAPSVNAEEVHAKETASEGAVAALAWAKKIASNDEYAFGTGQAAHSTGCAFCKVKKKGKKITTNRWKKEKLLKQEGKKWSKKWNKTYCCNAFIFSAYAHGAKDKQMLKDCKKGKNGKWWEKELVDLYDGFEYMGKLEYDQLLPGDIVFENGNCWMYAGGKSYVEASREGFGKNSIAVHKKGAKKKYKNSKYVIRYTK